MERWFPSLQVFLVSQYSSPGWHKGEQVAAALRRRGVDVFFKQTTKGSRVWDRQDNSANERETTHALLDADLVVLFVTDGAFIDTIPSQKKCHRFGLTQLMRIIRRFQKRTLLCRADEVLSNEAITRILESESVPGEGILNLLDGKNAGSFVEWMTGETPGGVMNIIYDAAVRARNLNDAFYLGAEKGLVDNENEEDEIVSLPSTSLPLQENSFSDAPPRESAPNKVQNREKRKKEKKKKAKMKQESNISTLLTTCVAEPPKTAVELRNEAILLRRTARFGALDILSTSADAMMMRGVASMIALTARTKVLQKKNHKKNSSDNMKEITSNELCPAADISSNDYHQDVAALLGGLMHNFGDFADLPKTSNELGKDAVFWFNKVLEFDPNDVLEAQRGSYGCSSSNSTRKFSSQPKSRLQPLERIEDDWDTLKRKMDAKVMLAGALSVGIGTKEAFIGDNFKLEDQDDEDRSVSDNGGSGRWNNTRIAGSQKKSMKKRIETAPDEQRGEKQSGQDDCTLVADFDVKLLFEVVGKEATAAEVPAETVTENEEICIEEGKRGGDKKKAMPEIEKNTSCSNESKNSAESFPTESNADASTKIPSARAFAEALSALGECAYHGEGIPQDRVLAAKLQRHAASFNLPAALANLSEMMASGEGGVAKDDQQRLNLLQKASIPQMVSVPSLATQWKHRANESATDSIGGVKDPNLCVSTIPETTTLKQVSSTPSILLPPLISPTKTTSSGTVLQHRLQMEPGLAEAQVKLGEALENGWGLGSGLPDPEAAGFYYKLAVLNGSTLAEERLDQLTQRLAEGVFDDVTKLREIQENDGKAAEEGTYNNERGGEEEYSENIEDIGEPVARETIDFHS